MRINRLDSLTLVFLKREIHVPNKPEVSMNYVIQKDKYKATWRHMTCFGIIPEQQFGEDIYRRIIEETSFSLPILLLHPPRTPYEHL